MNEAHVEIDAQELRNYLLFIIFMVYFSYLDSP
jgi:hypothetical protein